MVIFRIDYRQENGEGKRIFVVSKSLLFALQESADIIGSSTKIEAIFRVSDPEDTVLTDKQN